MSGDMTLNSGDAIFFLLIRVVGSWSKPEQSAVAYSFFLDLSPSLLSPFCCKFLFLPALLTLF